MEFEIESTKHSPEDVLRYLFDKGERVTTEFYFEQVKSYIKGELDYIKKLPFAEMLTQENHDRRKRVFNTIVLMLQLPLSLDYNKNSRSYKIDENLDYDVEDVRSLLHTAIHNTKDTVSRIPEDYYNAPASAKYHGAFAGGLMYHSIAVLRAVLETCNVYLSDKYYEYLKVEQDQKTRTDIYTAMLNSICVNMVGILLHDFCKVDKYVYNPLKEKYEYNSNEIPSFQHGAESYRRIIHEGFRLSKEWELAVVYHMGNWGVSETESKDFSTITEKVPEVLLLHHADMIAAKIYHL